MNKTEVKQMGAREFFERMDQMTEQEVDEHLARLCRQYGIEPMVSRRKKDVVEKPLRIAY